jgi:hypothetical protein
VQLEGEPVGVLAGGKFVLFKRGGREGAEQRGETGLDGGDPFLDRPGVGAHLQRRGSEEAAAGEDAALHIAEKRLAHRCQLGQAEAGRQCGLDDFCVEDPLRGITLDGLETTIHGDLDLHGFLGLNSNVRPGYEQIQVTIKATGDFDDNQLAELASLTRYSPVRDIVSNPVPIAIDLTRA